MKRVDLYTRPPAPGTGVVYVDESPRQLIGGVRPTTPAAVDFATWLRKLELHYVPKDASWLNMVEIEIGVLASQRLARRIRTSTP